MVMRLLLLALLSVPAAAQVRVAVEPAAPLTGPAAGGLTALGTTLSAASLAGGDLAPALNGSFEASRLQAPSKPEVLAAASVAATKPALEPSHAASFTTTPRSKVATAAWETAETGAATIPFLAAAAILKANVHETAYLVPAMLGLWGVSYLAMRAQLAGLRAKVVGGWQASHDQKYRTDYGTGQMRDIRGQKYGSDRYEEMQDGAVGALAASLMALTAALAAAAFLML